MIGSSFAFFVENAELDAEQSTVRSQAGHLIDTSGDVWRIDADSSVNWTRFGNLNGDVVAACKAYIRHLIRNNSPQYVSGQHLFMRVLADDTLTRDVNHSIEVDDVLTRGVFERFKAKVRKTVSEANIGTYTGAFVRWYIWCTDAGFTVFDPDLATEFESLVIGGNPQGQAVLSNDPNRGPLREVEMVAFRSALKAAARDGTLSDQDLALAWLMIAFGCNPRNLSLLEEKDLIRTDLDDGQIVYELRIPRIKKRTSGERDQFRTRRVVPDIAHLLVRMIKDNRDSGTIEDASRPLFKLEKPRQSLIGTAFEGNALRCPSKWFTRRLRIIGSTLKLQNYEGHPLHLSPRRLRYSFATRLVQEGASIRDVADALDHTSTDHVMVYFNARSDAVRKLDRALSIILAPVAQAFMGKIIKDRTEATRAGDPRSNIRHRNPGTKRFEHLGNCGDFGVCGLFAPIACYTCKSFQAWIDGPHEQVFDALEQRRNQKLAEGADPKWTQLHDETMLAVQFVMLRCAALKAEAAVA